MKIPSIIKYLIASISIPTNKIDIVREKSCPDECWCWFRDDDRNPDLPCELKKTKG